MSEPVPSSADLDSESFRRHGHQVIDWIADFLADPERYPVMPPTQPGDVRNALPSSPPEHGEPMDRILADFQSVIAPNSTQWNHPSFFAYFATTGSGPGILAEALCAALNNNA